MLKKTPLKRSNTPLKKTSLKRGKPLQARKKTEEELRLKKEESLKMKAFFLYCWNLFPHYSEIGPEYKFLGTEPKTIFFHHAEEKSIHPELKYASGCILVVTADEHSCLNGDLNYFKEAVDRRISIAENYEELVEQSNDWEEMYENMKNNM